MHEPNDKISRRSFLKGVGVITLAAGTATVAGCESTTDVPLTVNGLPQPTPVPVAFQYPEVPYTPTQVPDPNVLRVFTPHEAATVEALTARILPGTPDDPGAREAGVVTYVDNYLATNEGFAQPTYRQPPFAEAEGGASAPMLPDQMMLQSSSNARNANTGQGQSGQGQSGQGGQSQSGGSAQNGTQQTITVPADLIDRYGPQSILSPRETYRVGLAAVDRYANSSFGNDFVALTEAQQDQIVGDMADGKATGFDRNVTAQNFFGVLYKHTAEGMFCDPVYGGNRNFVGWKLIGFPGAQRAYDSSEMQRKGTNRQPQGILQLHPFNPGQNVNSQVILPVSGSRPDGQQPPAPPSENAK